MVYIYTWDNKWIQDDESLWGIIEKFKLANALTGEGFFNSFKTNRNSIFSNNLEGQSSLHDLRRLDITKLNNALNIDCENYTKNFLNQMNIFKLDIPIFHSQLFFCEKCLSNSFHSMFHQLRVVEYCPYHLNIKMTNICPSCGNNFRYYNLGSFEKAFCCENCGFSSDNDIFLVKIKKWGISPQLITPIYNSLNINGVGKCEFHFIVPTQNKKGTKRLSYTKLLRLLKIDFEDLKQPFSKDKSRKFQLRYSGNLNIKRCHNFRNILPQRLPFSPFFIDRCLDLILFNQSKAILKSVERYILKQIGKKNICSIKKCYGPTGFIEEKSHESPFTVWKNECYGEWIHDIRYGNYKTFNRKNPASDYEKQVFPYLHYADNFRRDLMDIISKVDSFSLIFNLFSKLLFVYLYDRYLEIKNTYATEEFEIISPHLTINNENKYIFI